MASFFPAGRRRRPAKREKENFGGHPKPQQRATALCTPVFRTDGQKFAMSHVTTAWYEMYTMFPIPVECL